MITWVTVWVLTVYHHDGNNSYQLTYSSQKTCLIEKDKHSKRAWVNARCDFQQVPMVTK